MSSVAVTPKDLKPAFERSWLLHGMSGSPAQLVQVLPLQPTKRERRRIKKSKRAIYLTKEEHAELLKLRIPKGIYRKRVKLSRYQASLLKEAEARETRKRERSRVVVLG